MPRSVRTSVRHVLQAADAAWLLTFVVLAVAYLVLKLPHAPADLSRFNPEQIEGIRAVDTTAQQQAHRAALLCIALFCAGGALVWPRLVRPRASAMAQELVEGLRAIRRRAGIAVALGLVIFVALAYPAQQAAVTFVCCALTILAAVFLTPLRRPMAARIFTAILVLEALFFMLPGLFEHADLSIYKDWWIVAIEHHYSMVVGAGDRLAQGRGWFDGATPYYGLLFPSVLAFLERHFGMLDFAGHLRLIQGLQIIFLLLAAAGLYLWNRRSHAAILFALLMVLPWIHNNHEAVFKPNQSALRMIGFPLGVLGLLLIRRQPRVRGALALGFLASFLFLLNPETSFCFILAYLVFLAARIERPFLSHATRMGAAFILGAGAQLFLFWVLFGIAFSDWDLAAKISGTFHLLGRYGAYARGIPLHFNPLALAIFLHAAQVLIHAALRRSQSVLQPRESFRAALAALTLFWLAYYVGRPDNWNLWTFLYLYGYFISACFDSRYWTLLRRHGRAGFLPWPILILVVLLGPVTLAAQAGAVSDVAQNLPTLFGPRTAAGLVSGTWMSPYLAGPFQEKSEYLQSLKDEQPIYFTINSYFIPLLSGVDNRLPYLDPMAETLTRRDFDILVAKTLALKPRHILFDDIDGAITSFDNERTFYVRLKQSLLGAYHSTGTTRGWEVLERNE